MKTKTKTFKRIFSLFLAVLCVLGVFFVSYIPEVNAINFPLVPTGQTNKALVFTRAFQQGDPYYYYIYTSYTSNSSFYYFVINDEYTLIYIIRSGYFTSSQSSNFTVEYYHGDSFNNSWIGQAPSYSGVNDIYYASCIGINPMSQYTTSILAPSFSSISEAVSAFNDFITATPTPQPTPTPAPATPTPDPGGSIPTPSGNYGSFFQRMAQDAQSAFNALYLSWTNANNRFYSSIFFIGLPLLITVFGIVAGIILGDDD